MGQEGHSFGGGNPGIVYVIVKLNFAAGEGGVKTEQKRKGLSNSRRVTSGHTWRFFALNERFLVLNSNDH